MKTNQLLPSAGDSGYVIVSQGDTTFPAGQLSLIRSLADLTANSVRTEFPTETLEMAALVFDRDPTPLYLLELGAGSRDDGIDAWKQFFLAQPDQRLSYLLPRSWTEETEPAPK